MQLHVQSDSSRQSSDCALGESAKARRVPLEFVRNEERPHVLQLSGPVDLMVSPQQAEELSAKLRGLVGPDGPTNPREAVEMRFTLPPMVGELQMMEPGGGLSVHRGSETRYPGPRNKNCSGRLAVWRDHEERHKELLLVREGDNRGGQAGVRKRQYWGLPGGGAARYERSWQAGVRELAEESGGITVDAATASFAGLWQGISSQGAVSTMMTCSARYAGGEIRPDKNGEIAEAGWFAQDAALALVSASNRAVLNAVFAGSCTPIALSDKEDRWVAKVPQPEIFAVPSLALAAAFFDKAPSKPQHTCLIVASSTLDGGGSSLLNEAQSRGFKTCELSHDDPAQSGVALLAKLKETLGQNWRAWRMIHVAESRESMEAARAALVEFAHPDATLVYHASR